MTADAPQAEWWSALPDPVAWLLRLVNAALAYLLGVVPPDDHRLLLLRVIVPLGLGLATIVLMRGTWWPPSWRQRREPRAEPDEVTK